MSLSNHPEDNYRVRGADNCQECGTRLYSYVNVHQKAQSDAHWRCRRCLSDWSDQVDSIVDSMTEYE